MAGLTLSDGVTLMHPREALTAAGNLGALNAEIITRCDGSSVVTLDLRGTFSHTVEVAGTVDGTNWTLIPMRPINVASVLYVAAVTGAVPGAWIGSCAGFRQVRARVTAWTSGASQATLCAQPGVIDPGTMGAVTGMTGTITQAAGVAATLTLASPGAGLRHYLTYLSINRFAGVALTAAATPVIVTTTNIPGSLAFTFPADALALGAMDRWREDFAYAIASTAQGTATTIVCPATTGVIWRVTAGYYVAP